MNRGLSGRRIRFQRYQNSGLLRTHPRKAPRKDWNIKGLPFRCYVRMVVAYIQENRSHAANNAVCDASIHTRSSRVSILYKHIAVRYTLA